MLMKYGFSSSILFIIAVTLDDLSWGLYHFYNLFQTGYDQWVRSIKNHGYHFSLKDLNHLPSNWCLNMIFFNRVEELTVILLIQMIAHSSSLPVVTAIALYEIRCSYCMVSSALSSHSSCKSCLCTVSCITFVFSLFSDWISVCCKVRSSCSSGNVDKRSYKDVWSLLISLEEMHTLPIMITII